VTVSTHSTHGACSHWLTDVQPNIDRPVNSDVRMAAVLSVGWLDHCTACWATGCRFMSVLPRRCYARHTCSLYGRSWIEMPGCWPHFCQCSRVFPCLPSPITADHYRYSKRIGIGGDMIYHIHQYCNTASIHSPISHISLTPIATGICRSLTVIVLKKPGVKMCLNLQHVV